MKYLHIMHNDKFNTSYIEFLEKNFNIKEHIFIFLGGEDRIKIPVLEKKFIIDLNRKYNIENEKNKIIKKIKILAGVFYIIRQIKKKENEKTYLHGLFNPYLILGLFFIPKNLEKCNWLIWGGDLYSYIERKSNNVIKNKYYSIENNVKKNFGGYITQVKGDYELAKKWFGAKGKHYDCFMYLSNLYVDKEVKKIEKEDIYIQVGNSSTLSNNHFEILDKLEKFKDKKIKLFCILSYGDKEYAKKVIAYGKKKFGEKFIPIVNFMKIEEYLEFISKIDIAIFAHNRQQGVGNVTSLLSMGKTVYLKKEVTTYKMLKELGVVIGEFENFDYLDLIEENDIKKNKEILKKRFSEERLLEDLKNVFK